MSGLPNTKNTISCGSEIKALAKEIGGILSDCNLGRQKHEELLACLHQLQIFGSIVESIESVVRKD